MFPKGLTSKYKLTKFESTWLDWLLNWAFKQYILRPLPISQSRYLWRRFSPPPDPHCHTDADCDANHPNHDHICMRPNCDQYTSPDCCMPICQTDSGEHADCCPVKVGWGGKCEVWEGKNILSDNQCNNSFKNYDETINSWSKLFHERDF